MKKVIYIIYLSLLMLTPVTMQAKGAGAKIKFDNSLHNFEVVYENGGVVSHNFVFTNTGDAPLVIIDINTNCGCTTAQYPQAPILPGKQDSISITFDPKGNPGEFAKEIIIKTNENKKRSKLRIKGVVIPQE